MVSLVYCKRIIDGRKQGSGLVSTIGLKTGFGGCVARGPGWLQPTVLKLEHCQSLRRTTGKESMKNLRSAEKFKPLSDGFGEHREKPAHSLQSSICYVPIEEMHTKSGSSPSDVIGR